MYQKFDSSAGPPTATDVLHRLAYLGHFLRMHAGGRGGKQFVLVTLARNGGHLSQREVLESCHISAAAMSEVLSKLESEGLLTRTISTKDRRQLDIELTAHGRERAQEIARERQRFEDQALSCLNEDEVSDLTTLLDKVCTHWQDLEKREREVSL